MSRGRKPLSPNEAGVTVKLSRELLDRIRAFADREFISRATAIKILLERGVENVESL
jgi:hypothetical protein